MKITFEKASNVLSNTVIQGNLSSIDLDSSMTSVALTEAVVTVSLAAKK
jgi:hypothetical protein